MSLVGWVAQKILSKAAFVFIHNLLVFFKHWLRQKSPLHIKSEPEEDNGFDPSSPKHKPAKRERVDEEEWATCSVCYMFTNHKSCVVTVQLLTHAVILHRVSGCINACVIHVSMFVYSLDLITSPKKWRKRMRKKPKRDDKTTMRRMMRRRYSYEEHSFTSSLSTNVIHWYCYTHNHTLTCMYLLGHQAQKED